MECPGCERQIATLREIMFFCKAEKVRYSIKKKLWGSPYTCKTLGTKMKHFETSKSHGNKNEKIYEDYFVLDFAGRFLHNEA